MDEEKIIYETIITLPKELIVNDTFISVLWDGIISGTIGLIFL